MAERGQIAEVNAPPPSEAIPTRGIEALATAGRRLGQLGNERAAAIREGGRAIEQGLNKDAEAFTDIGKVLEQHDATQDILHGSATFAIAQNTLTQQWKQFLAANPTDPDAGQKFLETQVQPAIQNTQDAFQTRAGKRWAADHGASLLEHWGNTVSQGQAQLTGQQAAGAADTLVNNLTASVQANPDNIDQALNQLRTTFTTLSGTANLSPEQQGHLGGKAMVDAQHQIVATAIKAKIDADPTIDLTADFKKYGAAMGGQAVNTLTEYQRTRQKVATEDMRSQINWDQKQNKEAFDRLATEQVTALVQPDGTLAVPPGWMQNLTDNLATHRGANRSSMENLIKLGQSINQERASGKMDTTSSFVTQDFNQRVANPDFPLTPQDVIKAKIAHQLSDKDYTLWHTYATESIKPENAANNKQINDIQKAVEQQFMPKGALGAPMDPRTAQVAPYAYAEFNRQFLQGVAIARSNGPQALAEYLSDVGTGSWRNSINLQQIANAAVKSYKPVTFPSLEGEATPEAAKPDNSLSGIWNRVIGGK